MRNLKRALSLALASVMLLGMMVVGTSAASYPDVDENDNVEAIEVLNEIKVMIGDRGNFRPDAAVNRHEMAVIMAKLVLGSEEADNYVGTHPFTDVFPWADKYVAACYENNLISGTSSTTFSGNQPLTAVQAALMMLRALGYEHLTKGATDWRAPVTAQANKIGLFKNVVSSPSAQLTRNQVAQLALNALESDMVDFTGELGWEINGVNVGFQAKWEPRRDLNNNTNGGKGYNYTNDPAGTTTHQKEYLQLCEDLYDGKLTKNTHAYDDFDRPATKWTYKGKVIGSYMNTPDLTYTSAVKLSDIYKDLGLGETVAADKVNFYRNGQEEDVATDKITDNSSTPVNLDTLDLSKSTDNKIGGNGVLTQVWYHSDTKTADITMIDTFVGEVASVTAASGSAARYVTITAKSTNTYLNTKFETESFSAKDLISYTNAYNEDTQKFDVKSAKVLEKTATDTLTRWTGVETGNSANSFTAGDTYKYSKKAYIDVDGTSGTIAGFTVDESELDIYCDDYGYAIYVSGVESAKNYAVVIGKGETNPYGDQTTGVTLLLADGTQKTVTANWKTADNGSMRLTDGRSENLPYTSKDRNLVKDMLGDVVTYKVNKDGTYDLIMGGLNAAKDGATGAWDATNYANDGNVTFVNGRSLLTLDSSDNTKDRTIYTTEKTVFFVATKNSKNEVVYNVYTGYSNMPSLRTGAGTAVKGIGYVINKDYTTQADAVFIAVDSVKGLSANRTFVVKEKSHEVVRDNTGRYFVMPAIDSDGNVTTVKVDAENLGADNASLDNVGTTQVTSVVSMSDVTKNSDDIITGASFDVPYTGNGDNGVNGDFKTGQSYYKTTGVVAPLNGVIGVGTDNKTSAAYWAYTKNTKFYSVNEDMNAITVISASDIVTDANDVIFFVADDDASASYKVVKTVIVQKVAPPAPTAYYALPAVTGAQWSVDGGSTWVAANTATTAAANASIQLKFTTAPASIVVTLSDDSVQATTESPAGTYSFTMPAKAVKSVTVTPKGEGGYGGKIVSVDITTPAQTKIVWEGAAAPTATETAVELANYLKAQGYVDVTPSDLTANQVTVKAKPVVGGFTMPEVSYIVDTTDTNGEFAQQKTVTNGSDLSTALTAVATSAGKVVLDCDASVTSAPAADIEVKATRTLTVGGTTALTKDITGAGNVTIAASGNVTAGEHIKVSGDVTISDTGSIDTLPSATGNINVNGDITIGTGKSVKIATGKTLTIATGKTLTLTDAAATGLDGAIAGAGKLKLSAGGAVNNITAALENTTGALTIEGTAAPSALTWTAGKITVTSTGNLTLPATTTSVHANGLEISGTVKLSGDLAVNGSASNIDIKATGVLDLNGKNLIGAANATIAVAGGAQIKNVTGAKFYTDTTLATADITVPASGVSSYTYGTNYGATNDQTGWKATA